MPVLFDATVVEFKEGDFRGLIGGGGDDTVRKKLDFEICSWTIALEI